MTTPPHDELPIQPTRRRTATLFGCLLIVLILGALLWFALNNTETVEDRGFLGLVDVVGALSGAGKGG